MSNVNAKEIAEKITDKLIRNCGYTITYDDFNDYLCEQMREIRDEIASELYYNIHIRNDIKLED